MLDRKYILDNVASVKENCLRRGAVADIDQLVQLEQQRRDKLQEAQELNRQANETSKIIGKAATAEERERLKEQGRILREQKDAAQAAHDDFDRQIHAIEVRISRT